MTGDFRREAYHARQEAKDNGLGREDAVWVEVGFARWRFTLAQLDKMLRDDQLRRKRQRGTTAR